MGRKKIDPEVERKARQAIMIIFLVMFVFMVVPVVLWWLFNS